MYSSAQSGQIREILYLSSVTLCEMIMTFILILMSCLLKTGFERFGDVAEKLAQIAENGLLCDEGLEPDSPGKVYCLFYTTQSPDNETLSSITLLIIQILIPVCPSCERG